MSTEPNETEWWTFWGGPACGERSARVAGRFAPSDPDANPPEHLCFEAALDSARGTPVVRVHRYVAAPWPPPLDASPVESFWRYDGVTVEP